MSQYNNQPPPKKHITTGDVIWTIVCICIGFLLIYVFYLLLTGINSSTLYREVLHR